LTIFILSQFFQHTRFVCQNFLPKFWIQLFFSKSIFYHQKPNDNPGTKKLCAKNFSTKYTLQSHIQKIHNKPSEDQLTQCSSERCDYSSHKRHDVMRHVEKCQYVMIDREVALERQKWQVYLSEQNEKWQSEYQVALTTLEREKNQQIANLEREKNQQIATLEKEKNHYISSLEREKHQLRESLAGAQSENGSLKSQLLVFQDMVKDVVNRPAAVIQHNEIANNTTHNSIKVTNYLTDFKTYAERTDPDFIRKAARENMIQFFMDGQNGLAQFVVRYIIRCGKKLIICCSDSARKKFRFLNPDGVLQDDVEAKMLTSKLSVPIKQVAHEVYDIICENLEAQKQAKIDQKAGFLEIDFLDRKIEFAHTQLWKIRDFDTDKNSEFLNELAALLRGPEPIMMEVGARATQGSDSDDDDQDKIEKNDMQV
jgi:hypothetical protein